MVRRLVRREENSKKKSIRHATGGAETREQNEARGRIKKNTGLVDLKPLLESYAEEAPRHSRRQSVAKQLAEAVGNLQSHQLTAAIPLAILQRWSNQLSGTTLYQNSAQLKRILRWLQRTCPGVTDLATQLPRGKVPAPRTRVASAEELQKLLDHAKPALRVIIMLAADCGLRYHEARTLAPANVDFKNETISFTQKGGSRRVMPVTKRVLEMLASAPDRGTTFDSYVSKFNGREVNEKEPDKWFLALKTKLQITPDIRIHDLRRTLATRAYTETKDLRIVQQLLGHRSMLSTLHYLAPHDAKSLKPLIDAMQLPVRWTN